ncbi:MAG: capsule assembly Wzi family protein [bacterium]
MSELLQIDTAYQKVYYNPITMKKNEMVSNSLIIVLVCLAVLFAGKPAYSVSKKTTDVISISDSYFYRLINRALTISPSKYITDTVKPISIREAIVLVNNVTKKEKYIQESDYQGDDFLFNPLRKLSSCLVLSDKEDILIMSNRGERFQGSYYFTLQGVGNVHLKDFALLSYDLRIKNDHDSTELELYQYKVKKGFKHLSLSFEKGSFLLGPGYFGKILMSENVEPEHIALVKTEIPYDWGALGAFRWYLWHVWYDDNDRVNKDPSLFGMRFSLKPFDVFECALNRIIYYGGSGNPKYSSIKDYWKLFTAEEENTTSEWNTDQLASADMTFNLPFIKKLKPFAGGKFYTEHAWNDIVAPYQPKDDLGRGGDRFDLLGESHIYGIFLTTGRLDVRFEYTKTTRYVYDNGNFSPDGYSDNGYIIGHYIGKDAMARFIELYYEIDDAFHLYLSGARIKRGVHLPSEMEQIQKEFGGGARYFHGNSMEFGIDLKYIDRNKRDDALSPAKISFNNNIEESYTYVMLTMSYWL